MKTALLVYKVYSPFLSVETEINSYSVLVDSPQRIFKVSFQHQQKYCKAMPFCRRLSPKLKTLKVQNGGKKKKHLIRPSVACRRKWK